MKILMVVAALMLIAGIVLTDIVLGALGFVSLASAAGYLLDRRDNGVPASKKWIKPGGAIEAMCYCVPIGMLIALLAWFAASLTLTAPLTVSFGSVMALGAMFGAGVATIDSVIAAREDDAFFAHISNTSRASGCSDSSEMVMPKDKYVQEVLLDVAGTRPEYARVMAKMAVEREHNLEDRTLLRSPFAIVSGAAMLVSLVGVAAIYALGEESEGALYVKVAAVAVIGLVGGWGGVSRRMG